MLSQITEYQTKLQFRWIKNSIYHAQMLWFTKIKSFLAFNSTELIFPMHTNMSAHPSSQSHLLTIVSKIQISDFLASCHFLEGCILLVQMKDLSYEARCYNPRGCKFQQASLHPELYKMDIYFIVASPYSVVMVSHSTRAQFLFLH